MKPGRNILPGRFHDSPRQATYRAWEGWIKGTRQTSKADLMNGQKNYGRTAWCRAIFLGALAIQGIAEIHAQSFVVTNGNASGAGSLLDAITQANAFSALNPANASTITFAAGVTTVTLPASNGTPSTVNGQLFVNANVTIDGGSGVTIDGNHNDRIFFVAGGAVNLENLSLINGQAVGGISRHGGGGAGLGGAIFVANGAGITGSGITLHTAVTLTNINFNNNSAMGGSSGAVLNTTITGGGGMGGAAGDGGGGFGNSATGAPSAATIGANGAFVSTGANRAGPGYLSAGGLFGGGGGSGDPTSGAWVGGGGGGGVNGQFGVGPDGGSNGGAGGFGGGGGGGATPNNAHGNGGAGGFGGGGGYGFNGGNGGFGGGGGSIYNGSVGSPGKGGFGAGDGTVGQFGGGGLGAGGAVFVMNGADLTVVGGSLSGNLVVGGTGGNPGQALGSAMFLLNSITLSAAPGTPQVISQDIVASDTNAADLGTTTLPGLTIGDAAHRGGIVRLSGTNVYYGATTITNGVALEAKIGEGIPNTSPIVLQGGFLQFTGSQSVALALGTGGGQLDWQSGGLAARGGNVRLTFNSGSGLAWNSTPNFLKDGQALLFGSDTSDSTVTITNDLNLGSGSGARTVLVANGNIGAFSGSTTGAYGLILNDATHAGTLQLSNARYTGTTTVNAGLLDILGGSLTGATIVNSGTLALEGTSAISNLNLANANGSVLEVRSSGASVKTLTGAVGSIVNLNGQSLNLGSGSDFTLDSTLIGSGGLVKTGTGTLTLTAQNSYTGGTVFSDGTVVITSDANLGASTGLLTFTNNSPILRTTENIVTNRNIRIAGSGGVAIANFDIDGSFTINGQITGTASFSQAIPILEKTGLGVLTLHGDANIKGNVLLDQGELSLTGTSFIAPEVVMFNGAVLHFENSMTYSGTVHGDGFLERAGPGTTTFTNGVLPGRGTTILGGEIQIGNGGTTAWLTGDVTDNGTLAFNHSGTQAYGGTIGGTGSLVKRGSGTLTLSGTSTLGGAFSPDGGTINLTGRVTSGQTSGIATTGSFAALNITGSGANWTSNADTLIGFNGGTGNLTISGGATASDTFSLVGRAVGSTGQVVVTGPGSSWTHSLGLVVGMGGLGTMTVSNGAKVTNADGIIGGDDGSRGLVTVSGSGSVWTSNSFLVIGSSGTGMLNVDGGGTAWVGPSGTGTITLGNAGTAAGTLNIGAAAGQAALAAGTVQASIVTGGAGSGAKVVNFNHTDPAYTFTSRLMGSLSVQQNNGTTILTGSNGYTGSTTINQGVLAIDSDNSLGQAGDIIFGSGTLRTIGNVNTVHNVSLGTWGTFDLSSQTFLTISGTVSGGTLSKIGTGFLTLVGAQTYTGLSDIQGGFFKVESGSLASSSVNLSSATFYLANSTGVFAGNITGSGTFNRGGAGASVLTGAVDQSVATVLESGTLQIGNGGTRGSVAGDVLNNGTLSVNRSDAYAMEGAISGSGSFLKLGTGTTTLTAANTYTGLTTVAAGKLAVNGSLASQAVVQNGGALGGSGTIGGAVTIQSGGTLSPGNSPGQITLQDSLTLESGATLLMEFGGTGAGQFDQLDVQGVFTAGGTLNLTILSGFTPLEGQSFLIFNGATPGLDAGHFLLTTNLGGGLYWDTSALETQGVVSIVPEPSTWGLLAAGLGLLFLRRPKARRG